MAYFTFATEKFSGILVFYVIYIFIKYHDEKMKSTLKIAVIYVSIKYHERTMNNRLKKHFSRSSSNISRTGLYYRKLRDPGSKFSHETRICEAADVLATNRKVFF